MFWVKAAARPLCQSEAMTDTERNLPLEEYERRAQQAIQDFDVADGLKLETHVQATGHAYLELTARTTGQGDAQAFAYRAARADLEQHGDSWFVRRALRSLNDLFQGGKLPPLAGEPDHQTLRPLEDYTWTDPDGPSGTED